MIRWSYHFLYSSIYHDVLTDKNLKMSGIVINIRGGATKAESSVTATGQLLNVVNTSEVSNGSDDLIKQAVQELFKKEPTVACLFPTHGHEWSELQTVIKPKKAVIRSFNTKPTVVATKVLKNESSESATFSTKMSKAIINTLTHQWLNTCANVGQSINYSIVAGADGSTNIGFTTNWGQNETLTNQTTLEAVSAESVVLGPGESKMAELNASMGTMSVRITYETYLEGETATNYNRPLKDHHSHGHSAYKVVGVSNKVEITEDIELVFYSSETVEVKEVK